MNEFQTGHEAIEKSLLMHEVTPLEVINHLPAIYIDGKLDVKRCASIADFDFKEFLKCYEDPDLLNSYLTAVYYYPKSIEYTHLYHKAYAEFCQFKIMPHDNTLFDPTPEHYSTWYGPYSKIIDY